MDWNPPKAPFHWDWDSLALFGGKESDISKPTATQQQQQQEWRPQGVGNGSIGFGGACSGSELGDGSSKSSVVSDSSAKAEAAAGANKISEFNFEAVVEPPFSNKPPPCNKNKELARVDLYTGTSKEPLIGLKLGKRTYFEDVCPGSNSKNSSSSSAPPVTPPTPLAKKSRTIHQSTQSFHCQVEGCNDDLTNAKDYHRKHRVCERHSKCPKVIVAGQERRFCQQCSRFHDLSEFDQKKRSCRRRLSDHNARRRKPQPDTISFNSSRLSSPFHDYGPQMSFLLNRAPFGYTRPAANSDASGFKLSQMKESWVKSPKGGGINGQLHFPSTELPNTVSLRHDLDSLLPFKGTTAEVLNQGLEASVAASNLDGAPDFRRALSLLSTDSWGPADPGLTHAPFVNANHTSSARPGLHMVNSTAECWPDECLAQQARVLPLDLHAHSSQFQEFQLLKAPYEASFFDSSQMR